jgi:hypothetical protein
MSMNLQALWFRALALAITGILALAPRVGAADSAADQRLSFDVDEGLNLNSFLRDGPVAAHLLLRSGADPRVLIAFPAGNSGVGLWFAHCASPVSWALRSRPQPVQDRDELGRNLYGMSVELSVSGASELKVKQALLSSVRVLRDYQALDTFPAEVAATPLTDHAALSWARDRLDGAAGYRLKVEVTHGALRGTEIIAGSDGRLELRVTALSGETPLTPLSGVQLLNKRAQPDTAARQALSFLSYREKLLAGSWRFNTYFGRDTLMSVRLLMPALTSEAVQAGLGAVLSRLSAHGEVAHEEDIGEFAVLDHLRVDGLKSDAPTFNYNMIDSSFMLAPVVGAWLLEDARGRTGAAAFLARMDTRRGGLPQAFGADLVSNLRLVLLSAEQFAAEPRAANLIALKPGMSAGQWRDSNVGLGHGRFPYDVNAVFVPAALQATARLYGSGLLDPYLATSERALFARAAAMARTWASRAAALFEVSIANATARRGIAAYAAELKISADAALRAIGKAGVPFHALSLATDGQPVPVMHTDEGFALLFGHPTPAALAQAVTAMLRPFPAGLLTDVGVVVANPVFADATVRSELTRNAYHGTVVWSWQQAVLAAGLDRQLRRADLPASLRQQVRAARQQLWIAIHAARAMRNSELWSWSYADAHFSIAPFGASAADVDESNAAQLWSTVYLAIPDPGARGERAPAH